MIFYTYDQYRYHKFYSYTQLINWISNYNQQEYNSFLASCGNSSYDTRTIVDLRGYVIHYPRKNRIYTEDFIPIYCKRIIIDAYFWSFNVSIEQERRAIESTDKGWIATLTKAGYLRPRFHKHLKRQHRHRHKHSRFSSICHYRDLRAARDLEHIPYIRPARKQVTKFIAWDDSSHTNSTGWKESTKYRHQWEPRARRREKR